MVIILILKDADIFPVLFVMLHNEKETAGIFADAQQNLSDNQLKELFKELEQCARHHHGLIYDYLQQNTNKTNCQWLKTLLWLEQQNHCLYNRLLTQISNPSVRQMLRELRDAKMRSITLLQEELSQLDEN